MLYIEMHIQDRKACWEEIYFQGRLRTEAWAESVEDAGRVGGP